MTVALAPGEVHCWRVRLDVSRDAVAGHRATLAADEQARSERFRYGRDRRRFVVARSALRRTLAQYLGVPPNRIGFATNAFGKPSLRPGFGARLGFNLSHSADLAVIAVALGADVGVDVERVHRETDGIPPAHAEVARQFFSAAEQAHLAELPPARRARAFLQAWTLREAYLKARGEGLTDEPVEWRGRWTFFPLRPTPDSVGALAVQGHGWHLRWAPADGRRRGHHAS